MFKIGIINWGKIKKGRKKKLLKKLLLMICLIIKGKSLKEGHIQVKVKKVLTF